MRTRGSFWRYSLYGAFFVLAQLFRKKSPTLSARPVLKRVILILLLLFSGCCLAFSVLMGYFAVGIVQAMVDIF